MAALQQEIREHADALWETSTEASSNGEESAASLAFGNHQGCGAKAVATAERHGAQAVPQPQASNGSDYDVVVIGLGPVGLMCCNLLGKAGVRVVGLERGDGDPARFRPRAIVNDDETLRLLQAVDLADKVVPTMRFKPGLQFVTRSYLKDGAECVKINGPGKSGGRLGDWPEIGEDELIPARHQGWRGGATFYQPVFERALAAGARRFSTVDCRLGTEVADIVQDAEGVRIQTRKSNVEWVQTSGGEWLQRTVPAACKLAEGETLNAKVVISCEGAGSKVRQMINTGSEHKYGFQSLGFEEDWCVLDVVLKDESKAKLLPGYTHQVCDPDRPQTFIPGSWVWDHPSKGRHLRWEFRILPGEDKDTFASTENMHRLVSEWGLAPEDYEIIRFAPYTFRSCIAPTWTQGRIALCGDACHTTPPFLGQGMNQGFKDAANLCWKAVLVAKGLARPSLLASYKEERFDTVLWIVQRAMQIGVMFSEFCQAEVDGKLKEIIEKYSSGGYAGVQGGTRVALVDQPVCPQSPLQAPSDADKFTGRWLWQPTEPITAADGRTAALDELIGGYRFVVMARSPEAAAVLSASSIAYLSELDATVVALDLASAKADRLNGLFADDSGVDLALVRPDRIIFGAASSVAGDGDDLVTRLRSVLSAF